MKNLLGIFTVIFLSINSLAQTHNSFHQTLVNELSKNNIVQNLNTFVNFGAKEIGTTNQQNALNWLNGLYQSWGYTNIEQQEVYVDGEMGYNLIVTKTGTVYPDKFIIIDAHYDTLNGPGANDNGSGTVVLLELAKVLKNIPTEYSIKFIHFTGEELGLYGSYQYVEEIAVPQNLDIQLVFNIDQVGGIAGENNTIVTCEQDQSGPNFNNEDSSLATQQLATCIDLYSNLQTEISFAYSSDYVPFQEEGYVITGLYEYNESPYTHSPEDTIEKVDTEYIYQISKGALGALCFYAKAYQNMNTKDFGDEKFRIHPNPVDQVLTVSALKTAATSEVQIFDLTGKKVFNQKKSFHQDLKIDTSKIPNGIYIIKIGEFNQKIIVQHK